MADLRGGLGISRGSIAISDGAETSTDGRDLRFAGLAPENTLAAFRQGLAFKPDAVELDLHMSQDGALIVAHDPNLKRATGKAANARNIDDLT